MVSLQDCRCQRNDGIDGRTILFGGLRISFSWRPPFKGFAGSLPCGPSQSRNRASSWTQLEVLSPRISSRPSRGVRLEGHGRLALTGRRRRCYSLRESVPDFGRLHLAGEGGDLPRCAKAMGCGPRRIRRLDTHGQWPVVL